MIQAQQYYQRALSEDPDNPKVILAAARVNHELENYGTVRNMYAKLKKLDNDLAEQFAYLDLRGEEASRAADISGLKEMILWEEEEDE
jgi:Tfp pilus assembly protein PilF